MRLGSMWAFSCRIRRRWHIVGGLRFHRTHAGGDQQRAGGGERLSHDLCKTDIDVVFADEVAQPKTGRTFVESLIEAHGRFGLGDLYPRFVIAREEGRPKITLLRRPSWKNGWPNVKVKGFRLIPLQGTGPASSFSPPAPRACPKVSRSRGRSSSTWPVGFTSLLKYSRRRRLHLHAAQPLQLALHQLDDRVA